MDKENQIIKPCRVCGFEREYDECHRRFAACKKRCAEHYQKIEKKY